MGAFTPEKVRNQAKMDVRTLMEPQLLKLRMPKEAACSFYIKPVSS